MKKAVKRIVWMVVLSLTPFLALQVPGVQAETRGGQGMKAGQGSEKTVVERERTTPWVGMREHWRRVPRTLEGKIFLWERYVIGHRNFLDLTEKQVDEIGSRLNAQRKYRIGKRADRIILIMEIEELLSKEPVDLAKVEEKVDSVQGLSKDMVMEQIRSLEEVLSILTPEQRKAVEEFMRESTFTRKIMGY
jgi:hypothetical protein